MIPDAHTPCPACPQQVRDLYACGRKVLVRLGEAMTGVDLTPAGPSQRLLEYEELYLALEALRPFIEAHHANQDHAFSPELAGAREPQLQKEETPA